MTSPLLNVQTERLINDYANRWKFQKGPEKKRKLPNLAKGTPTLVKDQTISVFFL